MSQVGHYLVNLNLLPITHSLFAVTVITSLSDK
jgi:hypothetical protein